MEDTLSPEQIENWRRIIFIQLEQISPGTGAYAVIMPKSEIIEYWKKMKSLVETPKFPAETENNSPIETKPWEEYRKPKCKHTNTITGQNGTYCLDCEEYI